jgi:hypothetical protein
MVQGALPLPPDEVNGRDIVDAAEAGNEWVKASARRGRASRLAWACLDAVVHAGCTTRR